MLVQKARTACAFAQLEADAVIDVAARIFGPLEGGGVIRYRRLRTGEDQYGPRQYSLHGLFRDYTSAQWSEDALAAAMQKLEAKLADLADTLMGISGCLNAAVGEGELNFFSDISAQAAQVAEDVRAYHSEARFVLAGGETDRETLAAAVAASGSTALSARYASSAAAGA